MSKCNCGRFEVPVCCKRYLEDPEGKIVHTECICYESLLDKDDSLTVRVISCILLAPAGPHRSMS